LSFPPFSPWPLDKLTPPSPGFIPLSCFPPPFVSWIFFLPDYVLLFSRGPPLAHLPKAGSTFFCTPPPFFSRRSSGPSSFACVVRPVFFPLCSFFFTFPGCDGVDVGWAFARMESGASTGTNAPRFSFSQFSLLGRGLLSLFSVLKAAACVLFFFFRGSFFPPTGCRRDRGKDLSPLFPLFPRYRFPQGPYNFPLAPLFFPSPPHRFVVFLSFSFSQRGRSLKQRFWRHIPNELFSPLFLTAVGNFTKSGGFLFPLPGVEGALLFPGNRKPWPPHLPLTRTKPSLGALVPV